MIWIIYIFFFWSLCLLTLWLWKSSLFKKTWQEPYFAETPVLIESDDWGPGGDFHAERLEKLLAMLNQHRDSSDRPAVLTADIVLSIPNIQKIKTSNDGNYFRTSLESFPDIYKVMQAGMRQGTFVPQLHGLEHLNGKAFAQLCLKNDPRILQAKVKDNWWDWESLDSPLQGHYVDGSTLPTTPLSKSDAQNIITTADKTFRQLFGHPSFSSVAPCYLWNDDVENEWNQCNIQFIQTAGYRCTARDKTGHYIQAPSIIRMGEKNKLGQIYLVRNVMYEPVDGKNTAKTAFEEAVIALKQALPITISTHRYNYTRSKKEFNQSLAGLDQLLTQIRQNLPATRFLASPELGHLIQSPASTISNPFNNSSWPKIPTLQGLAKIKAFLFRLYYRHPKLVLASYLSGLIIPAWIICLSATNRTQGQKP